MKDTTRISMEKAELLRTASLEMHVDPTESENMALISRSTELSNAKRREPLPGAPAVDVLPPATYHESTRDGDLFGGVSAFAGTRW